MRALPIAAGLVLLALGVVAGAVFGLDDDEIFVSPPAVVAEEFVRAMAHHHTNAAWSMLSRDAERATSDARMRKLSGDFQATFGHLDAVHGIVGERKHDSALVMTRIDGTRRSAERVLLLVRDHGQWSVARASDVIGDTAGAHHPGVR
jgi:hypothetical protein